MKTINIKVKDKEYKLKYSIRALFLFERITGRSFELDSFSDQMTFFYCLILASNPDMDLTFEQFIDAIDNNEIDLNQLQEFVFSEQQKQIELRDKTPENNKKGSKKKS